MLKCCWPFIRKAVIGREYSKFVFTKLLSSVIDKLAEQGLANGLNRDRLEYMSLMSWLEGSTSIWGRKENRKTLQKTTEQRYQQHKLAEQIILPNVITESSAIYAFEIPYKEPNLYL